MQHHLPSNVATKFNSLPPRPPDDWRNTLPDPIVNKDNTLPKPTDVDDWTHTMPKQKEKGRQVFSSFTALLFSIDKKF